MIGHGFTDSPGTLSLPPGATLLALVPNPMAIDTHEAEWTGEYLYVYWTPSKRKTALEAQLEDLG